MKIQRDVLCRTEDFSPLRLCEDDRLPADIELVMGYDEMLSPDDVAEAWRIGLTHFPQLTGVLRSESSFSHEWIAPVQGAVCWEVAESEAIDSVDDWKYMPLSKQSREWIPTALPSEEAGSLWQARLTLMPRVGSCVIGMRVSHAVVDGAGLAWFIHQCTAARRGVDAGTMVHERPVFSDKNDEPLSEPPAGYGWAKAQQESVWHNDSLARGNPLIMAISVADVMLHFAANSVLDARLRLAAWLCSLVKKIQPHTEEVALWCDARGTNQLPVNYTGNAGCFLHVPLQDEEPEHLTRELRSVATRSGLARIADTYRRLKEAESVGRKYRWLGIDRCALQLNLVPHVVTGTDFGIGLPRYAMLLSRNSSGIRIAFTPDAAHLMVELSLSTATNQFLLEKMHASALAVEIWCAGLDSELDAMR
jgi:hypothetical protein